MTRIPRVRRLALAWFVCVLSALVGLTAVKPPAAEAFVNPNVVRTVGGAIRTVPAAAPVVTGLCTTGIGCVVSGAIALGITAYATQDTWMPWVEGWFDNDDTDAESTEGNNGSNCAVSFGNVQIDGSNTLTAPYAYSGMSPCYQNRFNLYITNIQCVSPHGAQTDVQYRNVPAASMPGWVAGSQIAGSSPPTGTGGTWTITVPALCPPGDWVKNANVRLCWYASCSPLSQAYSNVLQLSGPDAHAQSTTAVQCKDAMGNIHDLPTVTTDGEAGGVDVPSCSKHGWLPERIKVTDRGGKPLMDAVFPDKTLDYPQCFSNGELICTVEVYVDGYECTENSELCVNWWGLQQTRPNRVKCMFGPYSVGMGQCAPLRRAYKTTGPQSTIPQPDGQWYPDVNFDGSPEPDTQTPTDPGGNPSPSPGTGFPGTGTNPNSPPSTITPTTNPDSKGCWGDAWSWNPVDWIYVPVKCALLWAFKPQTSLQTRMSTINTSFAGKAPFSWFSMMASLGTSIPGGACPDWRIKVQGAGILGSTDKNVVCESEFTAAIRTGRPIFAALMITAAFAPFMRSLAYSAVPILSPVPTR